jgi:hypothetical protein
MPFVMIIVILGNIQHKVTDDKHNTLFICQGIANQCPHNEYLISNHEMQI